MTLPAYLDPNQKNTPPAQPPQGGNLPPYLNPNPVVPAAPDVQEPQFNIDVPQPTAPQLQPSLKEWDYRNAKTNPQGQTLPDGAVGWKPDGTPDFGTGVQGWAKHSLWAMQNAYFDGIQQGDQIKERAGYTSDFMPRLLSSWGLFKEGVASLAAPIGFTAQMTEQIAGSAGFALKDIVYNGKGVADINWKGNWEASRLAYSATLQGFSSQGDTLRQEFITRMDAGERPDLIAQDMLIKGRANVLAEFAGQLVFDPLNYDVVERILGGKAISIGGITHVFPGGKGAQASRIESMVTQKLLTPEAKGLESVLQDAAKGTDLVAGAKLEQAFQDEVKVQKSVEAMVEASRTPGLAANKVADLPERVKQISRLVPDSRRQYFVSITGHVIENVINSVKNPDEIVTIFQNALKVSEGDINAFVDVMKSPAGRVLVSEGGHEALPFIRQILTDHPDLIDTITKTMGKGGTDLTGATLMNYLDKVSKKLFPDAIEAIRAADKVKAMKAGGEVPAEDLQKLADFANNMNPFERAVARAHNTAQQTLVGKVNSFFSTIYMRLSPAFAMRNGMNNDLMIFLDYGPAALIKNADETFLEASRIHGSVLQGGTGFESGVSASERTVEQLKGTNFLDQIKAMFTPRGASGMAEVKETQAARKIVGYTYKKTFRDALTPLVDSLGKDERFASLPKETWAFMKDAILQNYGNADAAVEALKKAGQYGTRDLFSFSALPQGIQDILTSNHLEHEYIDNVIKAKTIEEARTAQAAMFDKLDLASKGTLVEGRAVRPGNYWDETLMVATQDGSVSLGRSALLDMRESIKDELMGAFNDISFSIDKAAEQAGIPVTDIIDAVNKKYGSALRDLRGWGGDTAKVIKDQRTSAVNLIKGADEKNFLQNWEVLKNRLQLTDARVPSTVKEMRSMGWDAFFAKQDADWVKQLENTVNGLEEYIGQFGQRAGMLPDGTAEVFDAAVANFDQWKNVRIGEYGMPHLDTMELVGTPRTKIAELANKYGIASATEAGAPLDQKLLRTINKYAKTNFKSLDDPAISLDMVDRAFAKDAKVELPAVTANKFVTPPYKPGTAPSISRILNDINLPNVRSVAENFLNDAFGKVETFALKPGDEKTFTQLSDVLRGRLAEVKTFAARVAQENRNFTLLNYGEKTYFDLASAYLFPYGFWYKGTYNTWIRRALDNPAILAGYAKYKHAMETAHADLPDWWKYNIKIDPSGVGKMLGIDLGNPLYFNLEATLWPLNGITGVDFNDTNKVVDGWTWGLDQIGKFGPSTWTPIQIATGLLLRSKGETDAANRWLSRLIPATATIKELTGKEFDPIVGLIQGGYDVYERRRIGRALSELQNKYTPEQLLEAAQTQSGPIWQEAARIAQQNRTPGQVASSLFGVGFKGRTQQDMQIDQFYSEYIYTMQMRPNLSPDDFKNALAQLGNKYPFMDYVLLSHKDGDARDIAFAYNVLGRMPPGDQTNLLKTVGINPVQINSFYDNKGDMSKWGFGEKQQFMGGLAELSSILKLPTTANRVEWNQAKSMYQTAQQQVSEQLGMPYDGSKRGIWDVVQSYYDLLDTGKTEDKQAAEALKEIYPIQQAQDMLTAYKANNPLLYKYYGSLDTLNAYYNSRARASMQARFGADIYDLQAQYFVLSDRAKLTSNPADDKAFAVFKQQYLKRLASFWDAKDAWTTWVNESVAKMGAQMPEQPPLQFRPAATPVQEYLQTAASAPQGVTAEQILSQNDMRPEIVGLVQDYFTTGQPLPDIAMKRLTYTAQSLNISVNELLQTLGQYFMR